MSVLPEIKLSGSADGVIGIYFAFLGIICLVGIYFLGKSTGASAKNATIQDDIKTTKLTFSPSQYTIYADALYSAMYGPGTDEEAIYRVFRNMKTDDDVKQIIVAFGSRRPMTAFTGSGLADWLQSELSTEEMTQLNGILSASNININF